MASTKIINVLKDDKFEEILDLFKDTPAKEVIFVLPKTSKAFKKEEHFVILENEAERSGKKISLLCSSPDINKLAKKYKFDILLAKSGDDEPLITAVNQYDSGEDKEEKAKEPEPEDTTPEDMPEDDPVSVPKFSVATYQEDGDENGEYQLVTISKTKRGLEGIVKQSGKPLKIDLQKERPVSLDVKRKPTYQSIDDIRNIWKDQSERASIIKDSIWTGINNRTKKSFKNFSKKLVVILGTVSVVLLGIIIYMATGSAKIEITPHKQPLNIQLNVSASDKFSVIDIGNNQIPGQLFDVEKSTDQTFPTSGQKDVAQKARGTIAVYNEYGTAAQPLVATTRFQTPDGLIFRTLKGVIVPGTVVAGGKIIPGSINVEVIADKAGQEYNIQAGKFSIPAFNEKGDILRYEKIYGKSDTAMKGGIVGKAKVVTDDDFNNAKQTLTAQVTKDIGDSLRTQTAGLEVVNASAIKLQDPQTTARVDEAADSFTMTINGAIKTVGFKKDDLKNLIKQYVDKTQNRDVIPEKLTINYDNITFNETADTLTFKASVKGDSYAKVNSDKIKADLAGKDEAQIKDYFKGATDINTAKVMLSPFWVKRIPKDQMKIKIDVNY